MAEVNPVRVGEKLMTLLEYAANEVATSVTIVGVKMHDSLLAGIE